jgi:hypothetical protein
MTTVEDKADIAATKAADMYEKRRPFVDAAFRDAYRTHALAGAIRGALAANPDLVAAYEQSCYEFFCSGFVCDTLLSGIPLPSPTVQ